MYFISLAIHFPPFSHNCTVGFHVLMNLLQLPKILLTVKLFRGCETSLKPLYCKGKQEFLNKDHNRVSQIEEGMSEK